MAYNLEQFIADCRATLKRDPGPSGREAVRSKLETLLQQKDFIDEYCGENVPRGLKLLYEDPELKFQILAHINDKARVSPPHDHGAWATIFLLSGEEKNTLYRTDNGKLRRASEVTLTRGSILPMMADTAHVAECLGDVPAIGLHVYGGDILDLPRRMWHPETLEAHTLDWNLYEGFAQMASKAASAPVA